MNTPSAVTPYVNAEANDKPAPAEVEGGFKKEKKCNDAIFAILFVAHLITIIVVLALYKPASDNDWQTGGVYKFVTLTALTALSVSAVALGVMYIFAQHLVELALVLSVLTSLFVAIRACIIGQVWIAIFGFIAFFLGVCYAKMVWNRIPFAASNLRTALSAVRTNFGVLLVAFLWLAVAFGWTMLWMSSTGAAMNQTGWAIVFLFLLSYFWTCAVINNIIHVIVASTVGTWWYSPVSASQCWDQGLNQACISAMTYNFGSICFGSLISSFVQALKYLHRMSVSSDKCCCITACIDCILSCVYSVVEYFNKWAYTYVGLHGGDYAESGKQVMTLFAQRGWSAIISDTLADGVMWLMTLAIAMVTGLAGLSLAQTDDDIFEGIGISAENDSYAGFSMGFLVGFLLGSIMMGVVSSAVNAVIVCFAEAPAELEKNYPEKCQEMLSAWNQAYPEECAGDFHDVKGTTV